MFKKLVTHKVFVPTINVCRQTSSDQFISLIQSMIKNNEYKGGNQPGPLERGSSRCWDLGLSDNKNVFIGGLGPVTLKEKMRDVSELIDFDNLAVNKLHIEMKPCPTLLAAKLIGTFPKFSLTRDELRVIKLSYKNYTDQDRGRLDCLLAGKEICDIIRDGDDFAMYSGNVYKTNSDDTEYFSYYKTDNKELHASFKIINGYVVINSLNENEVGHIYTDTNMTLDTLNHRLRQHMKVKIQNQPEEVI